MADAKVVGREALMARLAKIPLVVQQAAEATLPDTGNELVAVMQRAAPVLARDHKDRVRGALRASIGWAKGDRPISIKVFAGGKTTTVKVRAGVADKDFAKAAAKAKRLGEGDAANRGEFDYVRAEEFGTQFQRPHPFFYPSYRAWKKNLRGRQFAKVRKALKTLFPEES